MKLLAAILLVLFPSFCFSICPTSTNVPLTHPIYLDLDKLIAFGLTGPTIVGQRPFDRNEIARMLKNAEASLKERPSSSQFSHLQTHLQFWISKGWTETECKEKYQFRPLTFVETGVDRSNSNRLIPARNGVVYLDAKLDPFHQYRGDLKNFNGNLVYLDWGADVQLTPYFALEAEPRIRVEDENHESTDWNAVFNRLYGKSVFYNIEVAAGRDILAWGHGPFGGNLLSTNARPFDQIRLSSNAPFQFPWIFKYLGHWKLSGFLARLDSDRRFPNPYLLGTAISLSPSRYVELGFYQTLIFGGEGSPEIKWYEVFLESFSYAKKNRTRTGEGENIADHRLGFSGRVRVPPAWGLETYWDTSIEDYRSGAIRSFENFGNFISDVLVFKSGIFLPSLPVFPQVSFRFEFNRAPALSFGHTDWRDGYTLDQQVLGSSLGPSTQEYKATVTHQFEGIDRVDLEIARFERSGDIHRQQFPDDGGMLRVNPIRTGPHEKSWRLSLFGRKEILKDWAADLSGGVEFVDNYLFEGGRNRVFFQVGTAVRWNGF